MKFNRDRNILTGQDGNIDINRNAQGVREITAQSPVDMAFGLGVTHALDRQLHCLLTRIILRGTASRHLSSDQQLVDLDLYMRRHDLLPDARSEIAKLLPEVRAQMEAYCRGFNLVLSEKKPVWELRLLGYNPQPWKLTDCLLIGKAFGFLGLVESQGGMEKLLVEMIQRGVAEDKLRELFPYLTDPIDYQLFGQVKLEATMVPPAVRWLASLNKFSASNNWVVSGERSASGKPIVCGDPHLEVNRLPAIWQEAIMRLPDNKLMGVTIPGLPGLILGRTNHVAWSATYSFMDMLDYTIERCKNGHYEYDGVWRPFSRRRATIEGKKGKEYDVFYYENHHGVLEGDPREEGLYLSLNWSGRHGCGADLFNSALRLPQARSTAEALDLFKDLECAAFCWLVGDTSGDIGFQMSGRFPKRPEGVSGLLPVPGWDSAYDSDGFYLGDDLPRVYNPPEGFIVTANNDLNHLCACRPINLSMGAYRAERAARMLAGKNRADAQFMKQMQGDLYSIQAERFMELLRPLLPETANGRILKDWACHYNADSLGATLFENVYRSLILIVFGEHGLGREVVEHLFGHTGLFNDYYANFDDILLAEDSAWFEGASRAELLSAALRQGLAKDPAPYGKTRKLVLRHLLFGGKLPRWLGFDRGPIMLPGNRATIVQGQIFQSAGRETTFAPSYRLIADMAGQEMHSNIPGGSTDRRFSKWYNNETKNWLAGVYKILA